MKTTMLHSGTEQYRRQLPSEPRSREVLSLNYWTFIYIGMWFDPTMSACDDIWDLDFHMEGIIDYLTKKHGEWTRQDNSEMQDIGDIRNRMVEQNGWPTLMPLLDMFERFLLLGEEGANDDDDDEDEEKDKEEEEDEEEEETPVMAPD
ncbi:hypothetical protein Godav_024489 [Gossypium davidsonii]|uniref:Uncharacterized protein n=1 Tax=Gossypium davidsonii TaxID=34287 RepID=A0A7J8TJ04_GOSDV|nr:hypothetical protein [Gossypium davidsonii]